jgi:hypothetical protein
VLLTAPNIPRLPREGPPRRLKQVAEIARLAGVWEALRPILGRLHYRLLVLEAADREQHVLGNLEAWARHNDWTRKWAAVKAAEFLPETS